MAKTAIRLLSHLFPRPFTRKAYYQLTHPQVKKLRPHELTMMDKAETAEVRYQNTVVKTYRWAGGDKLLMLMHGWEGQAGNFADFIVPLQQAGFTIVAFDAPAHGLSPRSETSLVEFVAVARHFLRVWQPQYLISHSFGGVPITYGLQSSPEIAIEKYVVLTTPNRFVDRVADIAEQVGIAQKVKDRLLRIMEDKFDMLEPDMPKGTIRAEDLNVADWVPKVKVKEALVLHDTNDQIIPIAQSKTVANAWPVAQFEEIQGTGHFRMLRTEAVIHRVVEFLTD